MPVFGYKIVSILVTDEIKLELKIGSVMGYSHGAPLWYISKCKKLNVSINGTYSGSSEVFKNDNLDGLFDGIPLVLEYVILLGYPFGALFGCSVGYSEGFKYVNIGGTIDVNSLVVEGILYTVV